MPRPANPVDVAHKTHPAEEPSSGGFGELSDTPPFSRQRPGSLSEEYSNGFSSLKLLAGSELHSRILYLLIWSQASITIARANDAQSTTIDLDGWGRLPLLAKSVDVVVVDLDAVPDRSGVRRDVVMELRRVLKSGGRCIAAVTRGRRPRNPRDWSGYRFVPPLSKWRDALSGTGLEQLDAALLRFEDGRITEIQLPSHPCADGLPGGRAQAAALVLSAGASRERAVVEEISRTLRPELASETRIDRVHVRKIGKTAAFLSIGDSRVVVRMPCSPVALARAGRNYEALDALHRSGIGIPLELVPKALLQGELGGQPYFVESCLPGAPRQAQRGPICWEPQAVELIRVLHVATAHRQLLTQPWFQRTIEPALSTLERSVLEPENRAVLAWLRSVLRERLIGRDVPLVRSHGDFTGTNCLYDERGRLTGVVDWELSVPDALPLLDLLQCFDLRVEYTSDGRWHRADLVFDAVERRGALFDAPEIAHYASTMGLPTDIIPALLLMHWVDHAGARMAVRQLDRRWFRHRVTAPLDRLRALAGRSPLGP